MERTTTRPKTVDEYIASFPPPIRARLKELRQAIQKTAPDAEELISYGMPAFKQQGMLAWYGAHQEHIGFYPRASAIEAFKKEIADYKWAKGSVQFPLDRPQPLALVKKMIQYRLQENTMKTTLKRKKK